MTDLEKAEAHNVRKSDNHINSLTQKDFYKLNHKFPKLEINKSKYCDWCLDVHVPNHKFVYIIGSYSSIKHPYDVDMVNPQYPTNIMSADVNPSSTIISTINNLIKVLSVE